jgi:hypothetical protein
VCAIATLSFAAHAKGPSVVLEVERDSLGTTVWMALQNAPFPAGNLPYRDRSVAVFVPKYYQPSAGKGVNLLVYFHGHRSTARDSMTSKKLREQLTASGRNALLMVPQLALNAAESRPGKLERRGGFKRLVTEALTVLAATIPDAGSSTMPGRVVLAAHSGGFQAAAMCISRGKIPIAELYLFDAMYGYSRVFSQWIANDNGRLVSWYGDTPMVIRWTESLKKALKFKRVPFAETAWDKTTDAWLQQNRVAFIKTAVEHTEIPYAGGALRRVLDTSGLPKTVRTP